MEYPGLHRGDSMTKKINEGTGMLFFRVCSAQFYIRLNSFH